MSADRFTVTKDHLRLIQRMHIDWNWDENGAPAVDPKRPYGNSDVATDVADTLGWTVLMDPDGWDMQPEQRDRAMALHRETATALQIVLCTGRFEPGTYVKAESYAALSWRLEAAKS
jgi:hypothetical protein